MAERGERRLVFDTRGRRKHVIRVVYAILAILMGASLFLVVGPVNIGELIGNQGSTSTSSVLDEQAERIERRLVRDPKNEALLLSLARTRIAAGNSQLESGGEGGQPVVTPAARKEFEQALTAWHRYLKQAGGEANASAALLVANAYFSLAQASRTLEDAISNLKQATAAQRIAARQRPNLGSLSTLAIFEYYTGNFAAGDRAAKQAAARATSKGQRKSVEKQLAAYRKRGKSLQKQERQLVKAQNKQGKEKLENPFGGLGGSTGTPLAP